MAELYKRKSSPYYYCVIEDPRQPDGRQRLSTKRRSRSEARAFADALQDKVDAELRTAPPSGLRWSTAVEIYLEGAPLTPDTIRSKASQALVIARSSLGDFDLGSLTHAQIKDFCNELRKDEVSDQTIRNYLSTISATYRWVIDRSVAGAPEVNPFDNFNRRFLGRSQEIDRQYRPNQFQDILEKLRSNEHRRILVTLCYTGMRCGELCKLRWDEVDFKQQLLEYGNGDPTRTKRHRSRRIALNDLMVRTLLAQKRCLEDAKAYHPKGLVFPSPRTGGERRGLKSIILAVRLHAKDEGYTNHRLRHTFASWSLQAGLDPIAIRDLLGHTTLSTTTRYARLVSNSVADKFRKLDLPGLAQNLAQSIGLEESEAA